MELFLLLLVTVMIYSPKEHYRTAGSLILVQLLLAPSFAQLVTTTGTYSDQEKSPAFEPSQNLTNNPTLELRIKKGNYQRNATELKRKYPNMIVIGDMLMDVDEYNARFSPNDPRKGVVSEDHKWPKEQGFPTVPYVVNTSGFQEKHLSKVKRVISEAIRHWETHTCLRFRPKKESDVSYLNFIDDDGCYSLRGRLQGDKQTVSLGNGCHTTGTVIHELGHAIGFLHEQMRSDRDKYVRIIHRNIIQEELLQFKHEQSMQYSNYGVPYDYTSVMQYEPLSFTQSGRFTIQTVEPQYQGLLGKFEVLSHRDKMVANKMYGCNEIWLKSCREKSKEVCLNNGYTGHDCKCVCPPGTTGDICQTIVGDYYSGVLSNCSQIITKVRTEIQTPGYPGYVPPGTWCVYQIRAPPGHAIIIKFNKFHLENETEGKHRCLYAYLILVEDKIVNGSHIVACGHDFDQGFIYRSTTNELTMFLDVSLYSNVSSGFSAIVLIGSKPKIYYANFEKSIAPSLFTLEVKLLIFLVCVETYMNMYRF